MKFPSSDFCSFFFQFKLRYLRKQGLNYHFDHWGNAVVGFFFWEWSDISLSPVYEIHSVVKSVSVWCIEKEQQGGRSNQLHMEGRID